MQTKSESIAWAEFMDNVEQVKIELGYKPGTEIFYRGHSKSSYKLAPGLFRSLKTGKISKKIWEAEKDMFYEFQARARNLHLQKLDDWDILFYLQHHGGKTRLLDWTEIFGVALFFALDPCNKPNGSQEYSPCIWMMNPYKMNKDFGHGNDLWSPENLNYYGVKEEVVYSDILLYKSGVDVFEWEKPVALYPQRKGDRLNNQGGYFTIHGNDARPIEDMAGENIIRKIDIPEKVLPMALRFLEQSGINHYTLFPDLDGLAVYLNHKYKP